MQPTGGNMVGSNSSQDGAWQGYNCSVIDTHNIPLLKVCWCGCCIAAFCHTKIAFLLHRTEVALVEDAHHLLHGLQHQHATNPCNLVSSQDGIFIQESSWL